MKFIIIILCFLHLGFGSELKNKAENEIQKFYDNQVDLDFIKFEIEPEIKKTVENRVKQRFFKNFVYVWKIIRQDSLAGFAILDNVYGKTMPITFMVLFDLNGKIDQARIIKYREGYGGAVSNISWLEQFTDKNKQSGFDVGKDIDVISGATISVYSVSKGINKITELFPFIKEKLADR